MAEDNFKRNLKDEKEFLQIQRDIKEQFENQVGSIRDYAEWQKKVGQVWKELKTMQKEINKLEAEGTVESKKKAAELKKEYEQLLEINKQLIKQGNILKATANIIDKQWGGVLGNILNKWFDFDEAVRRTGISMGISGTRMNMMQQNIINARNYTAEWGVEQKEVAEAQLAYSDELGRSVILSSAALQNMAMIGTKTGLGMQGVAQMAGQMEAFGFGAEKSVQLISELSAGAEAMGVNSGKVLKKFEQNLGLMNKLNFKNGVKGMMQMAKFSEKYKIDMNAVAGVADKVFRPEGAIEAAAQLQVLGGDLAALGDPFQLMYKARNAPEELAKSLTKAASASATFDKKTGEFKLNAYELDRMKEASAALNIPMEELVQTAKQGAKINMLEKMLGGKKLDPDTMDMLTGLADAEGNIQIGFDSKGEAITKKLSQLSDQDILGLTEKRKLEDKSQKDALSIRQEWMAMIDQLTMATWPLLKSLQDFFKPGIDKMSTKITEWVDSISKWVKTIGIFLGAVTLLWAGMQIFKAGQAIWNTISATIAFFKGTPGADYKKGFEYGRGQAMGYQSATKASSVSGGAKGFLKSQKGTPETPTGGGPGQQGPGGMTKGINTRDMIQGAAAILILSAALYVFAKALQEFEKLKDGWGTLAIAAGSLLVLAGSLWLVGKIMSNASASLIEGSFAILVLSAAMIPFAYALQMMNGVGIGTVFVLAAGLTVLGIAGFLMGEAAPEIILGALAIGALGLAVIPLAYAFTLVAEGISTIVNSFTQMFAVIGPNGASLLMAGVGFMAMAAGIGILTISLIAMGAAALFALPGLLILGEVTSMLTETASALQSTGGGEGIAKAVNAINSVDQNKLDALKDLSMWMALVGASPTIKFDESLTIDGSIQLTGQAGGKTNTNWIDDPIFVSKLKELIADATESDKRGGKK